MLTGTALAPCPASPGSSGWNPRLYSPPAPVPYSKHHFVSDPASTPPGRTVPLSVAESNVTSEAPSVLTDAGLGGVVNDWIAPAAGAPACLLASFSASTR